MSKKDKQNIDLEPSRERGMKLLLNHSSFAMLAEEISQMLYEADALNYIEWTIWSEKYGPTVVRIQRREGETPAEKYGQLRKVLGELIEQWKETAWVIEPTDRAGAIAYKECIDELRRILAGDLSPIERIRREQ